MDILFRVELYVKNVEESLTFYQDILGLKLFGRNERSLRFNYDFFSLLITSESILKEDHYFKNRAKSDIKGSGFELIVVVDKLEEVYERCVANNYPIEVEVEQYPWNMRGFKVADPDGYFIRVTSK